MERNLTLAEAIQVLHTKFLQCPPEGNCFAFFSRDSELAMFLNDMAAFDYKDVTSNYRRAIDEYQEAVRLLHLGVESSQETFDECVTHGVALDTCTTFPPLVQSYRSENFTPAQEKFRAAQDRFNREFPKIDLSTISTYDINQAHRLNSQARKYGMATDYLDQIRSTLQEALQAKEMVAQKIRRK